MIEKRVNKMSDSKDSKTFWVSFNKFRKNLNNCSSLISIFTWHSLLNTFPSLPIPNLPPFRKENDILDNPISLNEIYSAIDNCKPKKVPGFDDIVNLFYKTLPLNRIIYLQDMFNKILAHEQTPSDWSTLLISPLFKKNDPNDPSNYQFISLVNSIAKIMTSILNKRLTDVVTLYNLISEFQASFLKKRECIHNLYTLNSLIRIHTRTKGSSGYCVFWIPAKL